MDTRVESPPIHSNTPPVKRMSRRARLIGSVLAVAVLAGTGWLAWHLTHPDTPEAGAAGGRRGAPATTVGVATAESTSIPVILDALGTVTPQATVKVRPQVSGVMEKVLFKEGQMVRAGELMATIDPRQFELALMQASGQRQRDEAQLASARVTLTRFQTLLKQDSIARQEVDTQAALVRQLEGTVMIDKANEGVARLNLGYARVVAPISGRVGLRTVDVGNVVSSSDANGIALITQVTPIDVVFAVPQDRAGELQQSAVSGRSMKVTALDRTRSSALDTGVFTSLDNQVDVQTGTVKAKARFANAQLALFPSQFVNVQLELRTIENAVTVPVAALRHGNAGDYVYVVNAAERTVSLRPVQRGQATADKIQIASGLKAGEQVITEGADRLKDGAPVVLPGDNPRGMNGAGAGKRQRPGAPADGARPGASAAGDAATPATLPASGAASAPRRRRASQAEGA
ncbi:MULTISPECIES: efflux RND transporter periplasmic adaptor subunit [unclassified Polaromonas]|uniref:efflux RND transporter periplasmic adaptor subunit n=1 Tax=unclassified Polaromonas TaxID=2638319 RepID=UPI0018CB311F|nr:MULTISPECIES: efflux RND transporter periplasmic adaptor subunit [unclassified Polaromonas]MBG6071621.1 multidrug efflux system membrane fusion protein [Polaromonas sp. CG_9.7]MBG6113622.1 multidrug efflux system membrane fusion protein [Polaromonas sp. CG_9.2]MDH6184480.1 multidrug efflux system membrane fusion protein [Polaromonas sp. CG_23.6]